MFVYFAIMLLIAIFIPTSIPFISGLAVASTDPEFESKQQHRPSLVDYPTSECFPCASIPFVQDFFGGRFTIERRPADLKETPDSNPENAILNQEGFKSYQLD